MLRSKPYPILNMLYSRRPISPLCARVSRERSPHSLDAWLSRQYASLRSSPSLALSLASGRGRLIFLGGAPLINPPGILIQQRIKWGMCDAVIEQLHLQQAVLVATTLLSTRD